MIITRQTLRDVLNLVVKRAFCTKNEDYARFGLRSIRTCLIHDFDEFVVHLSSIHSAYEWRLRNYYFYLRRCNENNLC